MEYLSSPEDSTTPKPDEWVGGMTIRADGKVKMPPGVSLTVWRSDLQQALDHDPAVEALVRNFPPPNPEAVRKYTDKP